MGAMQNARLLMPQPKKTRSEQGVLAFIIINHFVLACLRDSLPSHAEATNRS
eukprot:COSAG02_NODE_4556_length_5219_cov_3.546094_4_plen_52_part_00